MRIKDESIFKRRTHSKEFRRNYFLAFEGYSEYLYFEGIKKNRETLDIHNGVDIQLLTRYDHDVSDSDGRSIVKKMGEYKTLIAEGRYSTEIFVGELLQQVYEQKIAHGK